MAVSRKGKFIRKVSEHSNIRQDVVEMIVEAMIDVMVDEIVNTGKFSFLGLFHVKSKSWKGYSFGEGRSVKDHERLSITLSKHLKELWKIRFDKFDGADDVIDKNNWRDVYRTYGLKPRTKKVDDKKPSDSASQSDNSEPVAYNPFLDDDDEDF